MSALKSLQIIVAFNLFLGLFFNGNVVSVARAQLAVFGIGSRPTGITGSAVNAPLDRGWIDDAGAKLKDFKDDAMKNVQNRDFWLWFFLPFALATNLFGILSFVPRGRKIRTGVANITQPVTKGLAKNKTVFAVGKLVGA